MRPRFSLVAAGAVVLLGLAGLVRGAVPQSAPKPATTVASAPIIIGGAYVREPANGVNAAAYFTVFNTTDTPDTLTTVVSGAGAQTTLHSEVANGNMTIDANGLTIPAHGSVSLSPGKGHAMIENLYGALKPGQSVNLELTFAKAGTVLVTAPVIAIAAPAPSAVVPK